MKLLVYSLKRKTGSIVDSEDLDDYLERQHDPFNIVMFD